MRSTRYVVVRENRYGFWNFIFDCFMLVITSGFWIVWIIVREIRRLR